MQVDWRMGLFTNIGRAWLTIDADIFIWKYQSGEDLAYFDGLSGELGNLFINLQSKFGQAYSNF